MQHKKVLFIITGGESGGAQTHLYDLCTNLAGGYEAIAAMGSKGTLWDKLYSRRIPVYLIPSLQREISISKDVQAYSELQSLIKKLQPDLICTHSSKAGFIGRLTAWTQGIPAVFTAHGWAFAEGVPTYKRFLYRNLERLASRWTQRIICVSNYDFNLALKQGVATAQKMTTIYNGIPAIANVVRRNDDPHHKLRLIMVARFSEQKDHPLFLQAIKQLGDSWPFEAYLVGDGPLQKSVRELASQLNIVEKLRFLGDRADVAELLQEADIFVLTSHWEGFPITILEAMRAGLPVIVSDVGGCREAILQSKTGCLIQPGDINHLVECLARLMADQETRLAMGAAGYQHFINNFTVEKMVQETVSVYDDVFHQ